MDQRLYQIVHDFMADGEGELTVWAGDVVEVDADDQGEVSSLGGTWGGRIAILAQEDF